VPRGAPRGRAGASEWRYGGSRKERPPASPPNHPTPYCSTRFYRRRLRKLLADERLRTVSAASGTADPWLGEPYGATGSSPQRIPEKGAGEIARDYRVNSPDQDRRRVDTNRRVAARALAPTSRQRPSLSSCRRSSSCSSSSKPRLKSRIRSGSGSRRRSSVSVRRASPRADCRTACGVAND
jgi:hypothetical protein